ncbi:asparagine synthase-domain-containing protein [Biscogniauxia mediterranea]|nr:asparagine synthase-domain-containing protein [Biscogniauxia mediterranea]
MCGIYAVIAAGARPGISADLKQALLDRGPDHLGQIHREVVHTSTSTSTTTSTNSARDTIHLTFTSTVLALRGDHVAKQPLEDSATGSVLCWNGEAWRIGGQPVTGNDGEAILSKLEAAPLSSSSEVRGAHILNVLRSIEGPFAFLYFDQPMSRLYFARDRLGRRSLLSHRAADGNVISFSSIADVPADGWEEVHADGIYSLDLCTRGNTSDVLQFDSSITKHDWLLEGGADMVSSIGMFNMTVPPPAHKLDFGSASLSMLRHRLSESLRLRVLNVPEPPNPASDLDIRVAVLFSGGLDCTVLARLAHELLPPSQGLDLINVAFENPRLVKLEQRQPHLHAADLYEGCPDRVTGRKAFSELKTSCPGRRWRFIAVNVPFSEAMAHKSKVLSLIYPHNTEMDLSIAFALYFAARGIGDCYTDKVEWQASPPSTTTPARVLLSGLGADELFGGYSRHEAGFKRGGYPSLIDELKLDVSRIGQRNLGRDDRVISHWGKEVRFPYLDEDFVRFAIQCPVEEKCDFQNQFHPAVIDPAKRVLRLLADQLGLPIAAREKKKAIQFGSRTAKIESATARVRGTAPVTIST